MQPIKTTNAMNPAPAKGIESFPTPVIDDVVISEVVNAWKGDYQPLEYGTLWKDVSHAPNQGSFPEHKLVYQQPTSEDGQWVKRIWVNDRVNQDSYNYAIKYSAGSQDHPIYIRTYIVPRETYAPLLDGTPDPLFPGALLVDEEVNRNEGELDSKYITVTRVYETLPGPEVPTKRYNERGDLETVIVQTVPPNTPPTADGLLVTQSQVEQVETGKGVRTTATVQDHALLKIKEKKEGLLGETITTDDIVDPSTNPDALSETVVASVVEQYTATKARKRTTTASGPTSLSQKSKDGKLLGDTTSTESVVAPSTTPDAVSSTILSSEVRQVDSGKAIKRNVVLNSTPTLSGNQNEQGLLGNKSTTESIVAAGASADPLSLSVISSSVEPIDSVRSRKVTTSSSGPISLLGGQKKEGLLGETTVTESIVAAGSSPDALNQSVVSSVVEPIDSAKSRKVTTTSIGPKVLSGGQNKEGLLGNTSITESIVPSGSAPDALSLNVISSTIEPIDSAKSKKINISSIGPSSLSGERINERGEVETVAESIVPSNSSPDQDSLLTISSKVEPIDLSKSKKTTVKVKSRQDLGSLSLKSGLLGETYTIEKIVSPSTPATPLSFNVLESSVDQISTTKAIQKTTTSSGPKTLISKSLIESPLGLVEAEIKKQIVPSGELPETNNNLGLLKDQISSIDSFKSEREKVKVNTWPTNTGVDYDEQLGIGIYYTETIVKPDEYINPTYWSDLSNKNYKPLDQWKSLRREIDKDKLSAALLAQYYKIPVEVDVKLPDKLLDVTVYWGNSYGQGQSFSADFGAATGSYSLSSSGSSKNSYGINGDIYFKLQQGYSGAVSGERHIFFIEIGDDGKVTSGEILDTLNLLASNGTRTQPVNEVGATGATGLIVTSSNATYQKWPYIQMISENLVVISGGKSETKNQSQTQSVSINGFGGGTGQGSSIDVDVNARSINIPPSLHGKITIKEESFGPDGDVNLKPTYGVFPKTLDSTQAVISGATVDVSNFPTGNYLYSADVELYKWGFVRVTATTVKITSDYV